MKIEKLSPVEQQRVLRFIRELAQAFRRIKRDAQKDQDEPKPEQPATEEVNDKQQYPHHKG